MRLPKERKSQAIGGQPSIHRGKRAFPPGNGNRSPRYALTERVFPLGSPLPPPPAFPIAKWEWIDEALSPFDPALSDIPVLTSPPLPPRPKVRAKKVWKWIGEDRPPGTEDCWEIVKCVPFFRLRPFLLSGPAKKKTS